MTPALVEDRQQAMHRFDASDFGKGQGQLPVVEMDAVPREPVDQPRQESSIEITATGLTRVSGTRLL